MLDEERSFAAVRATTTRCRPSAVCRLSVCLYVTE